MNRIIYPALLCTAAMLSACGGGSDDAQPAAAPAPSAVPGLAPDPAPDTASGAPSAPAPEGTPAAGAMLAADKTCGFANFEEELLARINQARAAARSCGDAAYGAAPQLAWNTLLADAGTVHATDMAGNNYFDHVGLDGRTFSQRIEAAGYAWAAAGENIAAGQDSVERVVAEWLASPGHCANIMDPDFSEVGVACVRDNDSEYRYFWAMELGLPR